MADRKSRLEHLAESSVQELLEEMARRRRNALHDCTDKEVEAELTKRGVERDLPPRYVEK